MELINSNHNREFKELYSALYDLRVANKFMKDVTYTFSDNELQFLGIIESNNFKTLLPANHSVIINNASIKSYKATASELQSKKNRILYSRLYELYQLIMNTQKEKLQANKITIDNSKFDYYFLDKFVKHDLKFQIIESIKEENYRFFLIMTDSKKYDIIQEYFLDPDAKIRIDQQSHLKRRLQTVMSDFIKLYYTVTKDLKKNYKAEQLQLFELN